MFKNILNIKQTTQVSLSNAIKGIVTETFNQIDTSIDEQIGKYLLPTYRGLLSLIAIVAISCIAFMHYLYLIFTSSAIFSTIALYSTICCIFYNLYKRSVGLSVLASWVARTKVSGLNFLDSFTSDIINRNIITYVSDNKLANILEESDQLYDFSEKVVDDVDFELVEYKDASQDIKEVEGVEEEDWVEEVEGGEGFEGFEGVEGFEEEDWIEGFEGKDWIEI